MAYYLPALLISVTAGMPDDAALKPMPRGQVDYLSHDWAEEDVWRSWRNMTKQKNEIANGVRLENASWRTWMKQRNNLQTVSPETLNWLKDSDVTWLYGPLHTAVDWTPKPPVSPPVVQQHAKDDTTVIPPKSPGANSLSSPSSSMTLDRYNLPVGRYPVPPHEGGTMKPILKHRSIAEMLTSALPPAPAWADENGDYDDDLDDDDEELTDSAETLSLQERHEASSSGRGGRPPIFHTKSDTNILPRFGRGGARKKARISPPRVAIAASDREPEVSYTPHVGSLSVNQRTGASNNLTDLMLRAANNPNAHGPLNSLQSTASPYWNAPALENTDSSATSTLTSDTASSGRAESEGSGLSPSGSLPPPKKHISFNAIVEQCIAIDGGSVPVTPSTHSQLWTPYDDGYTQDTEDGLYEDISMNLQDDSDSDDGHIDEEDDDEMLEIKSPSRKSSSSSLQDSRNGPDSHQQAHMPSMHPERPQLRRASTGSSRRGRSRKSTSAGSRSGSGSNSARTSDTGRSRSSAALDREHFTIAPIAPTILKAGGSENNEDGMLYMAGAPYAGYGANQSYMYGNGAYANNYGPSSSGSGGGGYGYGYGGYGYGERVSAGREDAFENFERGTDAGELVYQSSNGNIYPWGEGDAARFRLQTEFGTPGSPHAYGLYPPQQSYLHRVSSTGSASSSLTGGDTHFVPGPVVYGRSPESADEAEFEYFDRAEETAEVEEGEDGIDSNNNQQGQSNFVLRTNGIQDMKHNEDGNAHIVVPYPNGSSGNTDRRSPQPAGPNSMRERTPSPDFPPKVNPRIASLKSESGYRSPPPSSPSPSTSDNTSTLISSPSVAIPTPGISPAHEQDYIQLRSPPESPLMQSGLLSPPDMSPRGRCSSPISGSATSSSGMQSGSRSVSESRSDSRGRSRTRNSSLASSSDQGELERGRSRSRSTASGANSPLGESSSPHTRCAPLVIGGIGMGLGISGGFGAQHSGREVRDGRGMKLYRKTSEDFISGKKEVKSGQSESRPAQNGRGRNREGKRVSESLSPPVFGSAPADRRGAVSPPNSNGYRPIPSSGLKSVNAYGGPSREDSNSYGTSSKHLLLNGVPIVNLPESARSVMPRRSNSSRSGSRENSETGSVDGSSYSGSGSGSGSSTVTTSGRTLPPCIPEEDEQRSRTVTPIQLQNQTHAPSDIRTDLQPKSSSSSLESLKHDLLGDANSKAAIFNTTQVTSSAHTGRTTDSKPEASIISSASTAGVPVGRHKPNGASDSINDGRDTTIANRTADLMSSARTLLGTIWNGS